MCVHVPPNLFDTLYAYIKKTENISISIRTNIRWLLYHKSQKKSIIMIVWKSIRHD